MLHIETTDRHHRISSHRTLGGAMRAAARVSRSTPTRIIADATTLAALLASGAAYRTAQGEIVDAGRQWMITATDA